MLIQNSRAPPHPALEVCTCQNVNDCYNLLGNDMAICTATFPFHVHIIGINYSIETNHASNHFAGGILLLNNNFYLSNMQLLNNSAHFGGGIFISADMSSGTSMANMAFFSNVASLGKWRSLYRC